MMFTSKELHDMAEELEYHLPHVPVDMTVQGIELKKFSTIQHYLNGLKPEFGIRYIDDKTLLILLGMLVQRDKINMNKAHGRGSGYFFTIQVK